MESLATDAGAAVRYVIVNADDFGASSGVNRGIIEAHARGIVTSTSLMVRGPAAREAIDCTSSHPHLDFGLHLDLGEWIYRDEAWRAAYEVVDLNNPAAVAAEVERQYRAFRDLMGFDPSHLDSHQHVHRDGPARAALVALGARLGVPVRHCTPGIQYCGQFYGQSGKGYPFPVAISAAALVQALAGLPAGISELACHPGLDPALNSTYCSERALEVAALCDPIVRATMVGQNLELRTFKSLRL
jgi:predicted glycoside hydrolase/deacetylase ChbG (UPF0249 family)